MQSDSNNTEHLTKKQKEFLEYLNKRHEKLKEEEEFLRSRSNSQKSNKK